MSNDLVAIDMKQLPAEVAALMSGMMDDAVGGISTGAPARISVINGRFQLKQGKTSLGTRNEPFLDVIVVGVAPGIAKTFYAKAYDPKAEPEAPDCFSNDGVHPDKSVVAPVSSACASCPNNAFGSAKVGAGKACSDYKRLAVILDSQVEGLEDDSQVFQFQIPGGSLKRWRGWVETLQMYKSNLLAVATRISVNTDEVGALEFSKGRVLQPAEMVKAAKTAVGDNAKKVLTSTAAELDGAAPKAKPAKAAVEAAPAPKDEIPSFIPEKEETPAPKKAAKKKEPEVVDAESVDETTAPEGKLADAFAAFNSTSWDD